MKNKKKYLTPKQKQLAIRKRHLINFRRYLSLKATAGSLEDHLDMNAFELREYIESLWLNGMNWENYGQYWCVDHIVGLKYFDSTSIKDMKLCWSHYNLMPAFLSDNHAKGYAPEISEKMLLKLPDTVIVRMLIIKARKHINEFESYYSR